MKNVIAGVLAALAATWATFGTGAAAQEWPQRTVRILVAYGPGGGTDVVARLVAETLQAKLGQPFIVENKPGAGGIIGADAAAKAPNDGYTIYMANNAHLIVGVLNKQLPYDVLKSFDPVGQVATASLTLVTHPDFPASSVKDLIERAKAQPGKITYASVGQGTIQHFTGELFKQIAQVDLLHVPYRGSPAAIAGVLGKQVDVLFDTVTAVLGQVQSGELKPLAVTGKDRFPALPNVPTGAESGLLPGFDVTTWYGLAVPAGTPPAIVAKLNATLREALTDAALRERLAKIGVIAQSSSAEDFGKHMQAEFARWSGVREAAGIPQQ